MRIWREQTPLAASEINMSQNHWSKRKWRVLYNPGPTGAQSRHIVRLASSLPASSSLPSPSSSTPCCLPALPSLYCSSFSPPLLLSLPTNLYPLIQSYPQVLQIHCSDDLQLKAIMVLSISTFCGKISSFPVDLIEKQSWPPGRVPKCSPQMSLYSWELDSFFSSTGLHTLGRREGQGQQRGKLKEQ